MQPKANVTRQTVDLSSFPDLVVIYLGMKVRSPRGLLTVLRFGPRISGAVAVRVVCAWATAVMVTTLLVGTAFGAVYRPFASMVPKVELPPATPPACQLTKVLLKLRMLAVH